jgi:hypothetical protein
VCTVDFNMWRVSWYCIPSAVCLWELRSCIAECGSHLLSFISSSRGAVLGGNLAYLRFRVTMVLCDVFILNTGVTKPLYRCWGFV